jgi:hypothetical protein
MQAYRSSETSRAMAGMAAMALAGASLVLAAAGGAIFLSTARDAWAAIDAAGPAGPADGMLLVAGLGGTLLSLWLGLGMALSALSTLPGELGQLCRGLANLVAPAALRNVVAFVLGTTLTAALVPGTAVAGIGPHTLRPPVVAATKHAGSSSRELDGLTLAGPGASVRLTPSNRSVASGAVTKNGYDVNHVADAAPSPSWSPPRAERHGAGRVVVLRGDTLWSIAQNHLGPAARAADIDAEWRRWFAANRDVIGDDANLILAGQQLRAPSSSRAAS